MITKLKFSYRSNEHIVKLFNHLFYENDLETKGNKKIIDFYKNS